VLTVAVAILSGGVAEAFYGGVPAGIRTKAETLLPPDLLAITKAFCARYR